MSDVISLTELEEEVRDSGLRTQVHGEPAVARQVRDRSPLRPHKEYLLRWLAFLDRLAGPEPHVGVVPTNAVLWQFTNVYRLQHRLRTPDLGRWLTQLPGLQDRPQVLLATGDFGQRCRSPWESTHRGRAYPRLYEWLDERFVLAAFESTSDLAPKDIGLLPYVLDDEVQEPVRRDLLYSFAGALSYPQLPAAHVRGQRLLKLAGTGRDWFVGTAAEAAAKHGAGGTDIAMLMRSTFTLCPAGFGRWTFRLGQALRYGSIPVLLADGYALPHEDAVDWSSCALVVPEDELGSVPQRLRALPTAEVAHLQDGLRRHRHLFSEAGVHLLAARRLATDQGLLRP